MKRNRIRTPVLLSLGLLLASATTLNAADAELRQLDTLDELQAAFNRDVGVPKLVLLLSPT